MESAFLNSFPPFFTAYILVSYVVLFFFIIVEGEIALIIGGIFVHLGLLSMPVVLLLILVGGAIKMVGGYRLGQYLGRRYPESKVLHYIKRKVYFFLPHFERKPFWSIVLSKFIYGVNNATLLFAGYVKADYKTYILAESLSSAVWLGSMFGLGLFFSSEALSISHSFRNFSLIILLFIIGFMVVQKLISAIIEVAEELLINIKKDSTNGTL